MVDTKMADQNQPQQPMTSTGMAAVATEIGKQVGEAIAKATGKLGRPPKKPEDWPKQVLPIKAPPGYAIVADANGRSPIIVECYMIMNPVRGKVAEAYPIEGRRRGSVSIGSLADKIRGKDMVVVQYTPYPPQRDDGKPHIMGAANYPPMEEFTEYKGTWFHNMAGAEALRVAKRADDGKA